MRAHADRQPAAQIKIPRLQFVWRPAPDSPAKWYLGLAGLAFRETPRRLHVHLSLRGALLWSTGSLLTVYFAGAAALVTVWNRNPYNHVTYADLVLPSHWSGLKDKRGQGLIDEGLHEIRAGKGQSGVMLLNHGLSLRPTDLRGRMVLAQVFISIGYLHRGLQLLEDGLAFGPPPKAYREGLFRLATYLEDFDRIVALADRIEAGLPPGDTATRRWLLAHRVTALEKLRRYDEIEQLKRAQGEAPSFALEAAWARMQAARGHPADALREIAQNPGRFGLPAERHQLQLTLAVAARDTPAAREAIQAWLKEEPTLAQPRIQEIAALIQLGETREAQERLQRFFIHFGSEPSAVVLLFKKLNELPEGDWLKAAHHEAVAAGAMGIEARILYVQGLMMAGRVAEALTEFNLTSALIDEARLKDGGWSEGTRRLLRVLSSDSPSDRALFLDFFRSNRLTPEAFRFALRSLRGGQATEIAAELSILARNRFPAFQDAALVTDSVVAAGKAEAGAPAALRNEAEARRELRRVDEELLAANDQAAFARLKVIEAAGFPTLKPDLLTRRIQVQGALQAQTELSAALQLYLASPNVSQAWLSQLAQQWTAEQRPGSVQTLARETFARFPQAKWAGDLLNRPATAAVVNAEKTPAPVRNEAEARVEMRRIDETLAAGDYPGALDRIKQVERAQIAPLKAELLLRRIEAHGCLREQTELAAALGYYLSGASVNQTELRRLATQWDNDRQRDSALSLLRGTVAKFPQARWALELRKKIEGDLLVAPMDAGPPAGKN